MTHEKSHKTDHKIGHGKRWVALFAVLAVLAAVIYYAHIGSLPTEQIEGALGNPRETLHIWYTDEALTDYMNSAAVSFQEKYDIRVVPVMTSGLEYLDAINQASLGKDPEEREIPDMYVIKNDTLEKAYLAGLASQIQDKNGICTSENYPQAALNAVTYQDKMMGYPFYYETSVLLYNKTYMDEVAKNVIESEADVEAAEAAQAQLEAALEAGETEGLVDEDGNLLNTPEESTQVDVSQEEIEEKIDTVIPKTIDDILTFANEYDAPETVEAVFKWDVTDVFYNYFFVGNYMNVGGDTGDKVDAIDIYNQDTIDCLRVYQNLNQFFSIDADEVTYDSVLQDFIDGKTVFSVVTTDAVAKIEEAKANGQFDFDYGISTVPDVSSTLQSKSLSVTNAVAINGYSDKKDIANQFAAYLVDEHVNDLYSQGGKLASKKNVTYENPVLENVMPEYEKSIPMPKMIETSNYWVQLEIAFTRIWTGEDVNQELKQLSEQIMRQVTGSPYEEETIVEPVEEPTEDISYLDEGMEASTTESEDTQE